METPNKSYSDDYWQGFSPDKIQAGEIPDDDSQDELHDMLLDCRQRANRDGLKLQDYYVTVHRYIITLQQLEKRNELQHMYEQAHIQNLPSKKLPFEKRGTPNIRGKYKKRQSNNNNNNNNNNTNADNNKVSNVVSNDHNLNSLIPTSHNIDIPSLPALKTDIDADSNINDNIKAEQSTNHVTVNANGTITQHIYTLNPPANKTESNNDANKNNTNNVNQQQSYIAITTSVQQTPNTTPSSTTDVNNQTSTTQSQSQSQSTTTTTTTLPTKTTLSSSQSSPPPLQPIEFTNTLIPQLTSTNNSNTLTSKPPHLQPLLQQQHQSQYKPPAQQQSTDNQITATSNTTQPPINPPKLYVHDRRKPEQIAAIKRYDLDIEEFKRPRDCHVFRLWHCDCFDGTSSTGNPDPSNLNRDYWFINMRGYFITANSYKYCPDWTAAIVTEEVLENTNNDEPFTSLLQASVQQIKNTGSSNDSVNTTSQTKIDQPNTNGHGSTHKRKHIDTNDGKNADLATHISSPQQSNDTATANNATTAIKQQISSPITAKTAFYMNKPTQHHSNKVSLTLQYRTMWWNKLCTEMLDSIRINNHINEYKDYMNFLKADNSTGMIVDNDDNIKTDNKPVKILPITQQQYNSLNDRMAKFIATTHGYVKQRYFEPAFIIVDEEEITTK